LEVTCRDHPSVLSTGRCNRCGRPLCDVCAFDLGGQRLCPDCVTAGPSAEVRSRIFSGGLLSIALAVLGFLALAGVMVSAAAGVEVAAGVSQVAGIVALVAGAGGLAAGLSSREGARRTGSLLPTIGVVANALFLALFLILAVVGLSQ
jgi:hypothetical protein